MILGSAAFRIRPKLGSLSDVTGFNGFTWFGALNASARNSTDCFSVRRNVRVKPISMRMLPGPLTFAAWISGPYAPSTGVMNAAGFSHWLIDFVSAYGDGR